VLAKPDRTKPISDKRIYFFKKCKKKHLQSSTNVFVFQRQGPKFFWSPRNNPNMLREDSNLRLSSFFEELLVDFPFSLESELVLEVAEVLDWSDFLDLLSDRSSFFDRSRLVEDFSETSERDFCNNGNVAFSLSTVYLNF